MGEVRPLFFVVFGPKRHATFTMGATGPELVEHAEIALGGFFAEPASMRGREDDGPHRHWSTAAVLGEVRIAVARAMGVATLRGAATWDRDREPPFPALRRLEVKTPEMARLLPDSIRARPGTRYVEAVVSPLRGGGQDTPVSIDPGGVLSGWQSLHWVSKRTGERIRVTTDPWVIGAVLVESLQDRAVRYGRPPRVMPLTEVHVDHALVSHVGRASGVIDAQLDGLDELATRRPVFRDVDIVTFIRGEISVLGPSAFSRRYDVKLRTVEGIAAGRVPSPRTIATVHRLLTAGAPPLRTCTLDGCDVVVTRANGTYCCRRHRDRARADMTTSADVDVVRCRGCDSTLLGAAATRGTCRSCFEASA
jgi:hypothetical protein